MFEHVAEADDVKLFASGDQLVERGDTAAAVVLGCFSGARIGLYTDRFETAFSSTAQESSVAASEVEQAPPVNEEALNVAPLAWRHLLGRVGVEVVVILVLSVHIGQLIVPRERLD